MLETITLRSTTPCCQRPVRLSAITALPRETYDRTCAACGTRWLVERRQMSQVPGCRIDALVWTDKLSTEYRREYGE